MDDEPTHNLKYKKPKFESEVDGLNCAGTFSFCLKQLSMVGLGWACETTHKRQDM